MKRLDEKALVPANKRQKRNMNRMGIDSQHDLAHSFIHHPPNESYYASPISFSSKLVKKTIAKHSPFNKDKFTSEVAKYSPFKLDSIYIGKNTRKNGPANNLRFSNNNRICPSKKISILKSTNYHVPSINVCIASNENEEKQCKCGILQSINTNNNSLTTFGECKALNVSKLDSAQIPLSSLNVFINNDLVLRIFVRSTTRAMMVKYSGSEVEYCTCVILCDNVVY